jgi:acetoin utilization protein AcuC
VDLDAHHGDGVEALTRANPLVTTCSVHDSTIFPGTGHHDSPSEGVFNYPLAPGAGDVELLLSLEAIIGRARAWRPDVLLVAIGADGHETDPLSTLQYTYDGYTHAAEALGHLATELNTPVLMGGAGGYQPRSHTPAIWATFVAALHASRSETTPRSTPGTEGSP